jgi:hypothetical protein
MLFSSYIVKEVCYFMFKSEMGPVRFQTEPNRLKAARFELFEKLGQFGSKKMRIGPI